MTLQKQHLDTPKRAPTPVLTFHSDDNGEGELPEEGTNDKAHKVVQDFRRAWNNALDAFARNGIDTKMKYMDTQHNKASQNLTMFHSVLPDSNLHLFEVSEGFYQPSIMSSSALKLWSSKAQNKQRKIDQFELTHNDIQLFVEDQGQNASINVNTVDTDLGPDVINHDLKTEKTKSAKDFNYLLSLLDQVLQTTNPEPRCVNCVGCKSCKDLSITCSTNVESSLHKEEFIIKSSIQYDKLKKKFCVSLPLKKNPAESLSCNSKQSRRIYDRITKSLDGHPDDKLAILKSFNKQVELGYIQRLSDLDLELQKSIMSKQKYVIPWNIVHKESSLSTPVRIVLNASSKTQTGRSLNDILCKGTPKVNMLPLVMIMLSEIILLIIDLMKFYNSCIIPESDYHLQCIWWQESLDTSKEPELYVLKTHTYGVVSSGRVLELCLEKIAEMHSENKPFHDLFMRKIYVDDGFANCKSVQDAEQLKADCETILPAYGFKAKGYAESYKVPPSDIS